MEMKEQRQPPPSGKGNPHPAEDVPAPTKRRPRRLRGYPARGTDLSQRSDPPPADSRSPGAAENCPDSPEAADAEVPPGGTA